VRPAQADAAAHGNASAPRHAAILVLDAILAGGEPFEAAWTGESARLDALSPRDRAFARLLVTTALRRLGEIDHLLKGLLQRPLPAKLSIVRQVLRLGVAQLRFLDTPPHAAIDQAVRLARAVDRAGMAGLVNAVLRKVPSLAPVSPETAAGLNTPGWLLRSWRDAYGATAAQAIGLAHLEEPPLDLTVKADPAHWAGLLGGSVLPTGSVRLSRPGDVAALAGFADGAWWVQDAAAALPARLLGAPAGAAVLDLCAAPGGKSAQLAAAGARVTAVELDPRRADLLRSNLARLGLTAEVVVADAARFTPADAPGCILLDAPCTATGTLRRHPDIAWLKSADDVARTTAVQDRLLAHAATLLAPGGRLVYAVCALQPEEGPERIDALLSRQPTLAREAVQPDELPGLEGAITAAGDVMTLPAMWPDRGHLDGFYIARLRKRV
jgi:16S rRNA (cytosine967-C5)-methyltransferase